MNIVTIKKSAIAALTIAAIVTGSLSATTAPAAAGGKNFGAGLVGGIALGIIAGGHRRGYREDRYSYDDRRYYSPRKCWYEYRWSPRRQREVRRRFCN